MKKTFFAAVLSLFASALFAQSYEIQDGNVVSNTNLTYWCDSSNATITNYYWLKNISGTAVTGKTYKRIYQLNDPSAECWWCVGVNCYPPTFTQGGDFTLNANAGTMLTVDFNPHGHLGTTIVRYIVKNNANAADSTYIDITYNMPGGPASVNVHASNASGVNIFPNPAADVVTFHFTGETPVVQKRMNIYDVNGALIRSVEFDGLTEQKMDVSELANGIYFIRTELNGELLPVEKLVISR